MPKYYIEKEIIANSFEEALQNEKKAKVLKISEIGEKPQELTHAIGFGIE